ncbi:hypothetical protein [Cellulophaga baltica]|uniref:hypothetical protein n=1 Tax=Cellulophaga baltica TaxID=76594 RepID=UPI000413590C|nr:hypothetical protein [Cellulophaga baltica]
MQIDKIYDRNDISVRAYHICKSNNLNTIKALKIYYDQFKSFSKLKNCGVKSNLELIEFCETYDIEDLNHSDDYDEESLIQARLSKLTRLHREVINSFIFVFTNELSVRSKNAVLKYVDGNLRIKNFCEKILLNKGFNIKKLKNIGVKCFPEIENYISSIREYLLSISEIKDEKHLISEKNNFLIQRTFSISKTPNTVLESESIFLLTDLLIKQDVLFDKNQTSIFLKAFKLYNNQLELSHDDIAKEVKLTKERVRQIKKNCLDILFTKLQFIQNFNDNLYQKYDLDTNANQIEISTELVELINNTNSTNLSREFITYILYTYLYPKFAMVGNLEDVIQPRFSNARNRHNWNNLYLVKKDLLLELDFTSLINELSYRINDRIEETYLFNIKSYLSKFLTQDNIEILDLAVPIGENIINEEFGLFLDLDDNIIFKRNTHRQVPEYVVEALESLSKPSKLDEIYNWINDKYPNVTKNEEALRGSCQRANDIIYFGRSSTYGLKQWEKTRNDIKGGTIKDIITDLLEKEETPIHITEILHEIHKYRDKTNARNILTNLKLDPYNSFIVFNQKFVGLTNKRHLYDVVKYNNLPIQLGKVIIGKINSNSISDINEMSNFLKHNYKLTLKETNNILESLNIDL